MRQAFVVILCIVIAVACITPLDVATEETERILVVEGFITTEPGPHTIRLIKTARYGSVFEGTIRGEEGADMWINDNDGNVTFLNNVAAGLYQTLPDFRAEIGKSYILNIRTVDGTTYASLPELVTPVPPIDSLFYAFKKIPSKDPLFFRTGVEVFGTWRDPENVQNFYLWKNSGIYWIETHPELFRFFVKECCDICWVYEEDADNTLNIFKDNFTDGERSSSIMAFIEDDGGRFMDKYYATVHQLSISKEAYQFFDLLNGQISIDGDVFDPPPATIRGNIINLSDPEANVIGYFYASDVKSKSIFIPREILETTQKRRQFNDDCRVLTVGTTDKPSFWGNTRDPRGHGSDVHPPRRDDSGGN